MTQRSLSLSDLGRALRARWPLMLLVGGTLFTLIALFVLMSPPRYRSEALLRVQGSNPGEGLLSGMGDIAGMSALGLGRDEVETEVGVLGSRRMQDIAIDSLGLEAVMVRPRRTRQGLLDVRSRGESVLEGDLTFERIEANRWRIEADWSGDSAAVPGAAAAGTPIQVGDLTFTIAPGGEVDEIQVALLPRYKVHEALEQRLQVRRRSPGAKLIEVRYEDRDRVLAAQVVEVIVSSYLSFISELEGGDATRTIGSLRRTSDSVATALRDADEALRDFQASARIIAPEEQANAQVKRVATLRGQLDQLEVERDALQRMLAVVDQRARAGSDATAYRQLATFPTLIENRAIQDLLATLIELENDRSRRLVGRTENDPGVQAVTERIAEIERSLRQIGAQYLESIEQQMREVGSSLGRMSEDIRMLPAAEMRYVQLARERTLVGEMWVLLQKQLRQSEVQETLRQDKVRLVDPPRVSHPDEAVFPKPAVHLTLGFILAALAALTAGLLGLRSPEIDAERQRMPPDSRITEPPAGP